MKALTHAITVLSLLAAPLALAQSSVANLCEDHLADDKQPLFEGMMESDDTGKDPFASISIKKPGRAAPEVNAANLQLKPPKPLNAEEIIFPYDQAVSISYVFESAGASHALGYMYLDDAKAANYVNDAGELLDTNANGIFDLHEDLYNVAPTSGDKSRPYVGKAGARRCNVPFTSGGLTYTEPEIAMKTNCAATLQRRRGDNDNDPLVGLADARPGRGSQHIDTDVVGTYLRRSWDDETDAATNDFSDRGLFPRIPNLLEPKDDENGNKGIGQMVFLLADDDDGTEAYGKLPPIPDVADTNNAVPDYNVSNYDNRGILLDEGSRDNVINTDDRTVNLGVIKGGKEIVFFLIVYYDSAHGPNEGTVYPCLKQDAEGKCLIHLRTPINVFFSKSAWNMDQNSLAKAKVAERNIGCNYRENCSADNPQGTADSSCQVAGTSTRLCGWLDTATLNRLKNEVTYGNLIMPKEAVSIPRPAGIRNAMPHVIVGAPSTDPFRWILGFEDLPGGGDRDFNDVVFVIHKKNGGESRSASLSGDIDLSDAEDFVITKVKFSRWDDYAPYPGQAPRCGTPPCWTEATPGACKIPGRPQPSIEYSISVDCHERYFEDGVWKRRPKLNRQWIPVVFDPPTANTKEFDMLTLGHVGSQLCWKVEITSPDERCVPVIDNVNVGYQAVRSGSYSRSSVTTVGNGQLWGVNETPGSGWGQNWPGTGLPAPTIRTYDGAKDFSVRGRLYFASRYDPEEPTVENFVQRWDAGRVMAMTLRNSSPEDRNLYTQGPDGKRISITEDMTGPNAANSLIFPDSLCNAQENGKYFYDINGDTKCGTPTIASPPAKHIPGPTNDRNVFREWLFGWEDNQDPPPAGIKRPWPMGGINLSTVAVAVPPYMDNWAQNTLPAEADLYRRNFMKPLESRKTMAYVGTMSGFLHGFDSGAYRVDSKDECIPGKLQPNGYFEHSGNACVASPGVSPRQYGTAEEKFAYMPRLMLDRYRYLYVRYRDSATKPKPSMDASPTIGNVDFGGLGPKWTIPSNAQTPDKPFKGARTVLVSASGRTSPAVFALDITRPDTSNYPYPMWEFSMNDAEMRDAFRDAGVLNNNVRMPDNSGSRHNPSVVRIKWPGATNGKWVAIIGTDYKPTTVDMAGTVFLLDMQTGKPLSVGAGDSGKYAGVITLDKGSGIAGAVAAVDLNRDGEYDVLYVPTTAGYVYRINLTSVETGRLMGQQVKVCKVASAPLAAATHADAANNPPDTEKFQQIHSSLAVSVVRSASPKVQFYFGTSDNPDEFADGPPNKNQYRYHLMAYEDTDPMGTGSCDAPLSPLWVTKLDPGQTVWGGVTLGGERLFATTAVGTTADLCNLSEDTSGKLYSTSRVPGNDGRADSTSVNLGGHGISAPVVQDGQVIVLPQGSGTGQPIRFGKLKVPPASSTNTRSRILIYEPVQDGRLPR
ncbi:DUF4114 domain-containing protein [Myxococcus landrumensis]|uniref:DUF4114 domain-containing protein n=1 Tax=Myxococcus landrumensis TaxID=2813577 RepID=A0ABX7N2H4_9BACT|nr:DUF4114 domain-containing protein [Myxococcus landrumus]QSQ11596.1 DUF4114 domain-containing protein [Myxococcus landrumus]